MGRRGPKKTPKDVLEKRGSWRAKDVKKKRAPKKRAVKKKPVQKISIIKVGRNEDPGAYNRPAMPQYVTGVARKEWKRIVPILEQMGILAECDRTMLALYCKVFAEWREADELCNSLLIKTKNKNIIQHPALSIRTNAWERLKKICTEFGLSPSARTGLAVMPKSSDTKGKGRFFEKNKNA